MRVRERRLLHGCTTRGRLHLAALAQIRRPDTEDHAYYQRCLQRGKTKREATRVPKTAHLRPHLDAPPTHKPEFDTLTWSVNNDAFWISQRGHLYFASPPSFGVRAAAVNTAL